jgi:Protease inhibitor/seed storage/LTP family
VCVAPCLSYLTGSQSSPSAACCEGVKKLKSLPSSTDEKRFACDCVKQAAAKFSNIKDDAVKGLPTACGTFFHSPSALSLAVLRRSSEKALKPPLLRHQNLVKILVLSLYFQVRREILDVESVIIANEYCYANES